MFKTKRRKKLEGKEEELRMLKLRISELKDWCAFDSPEIGFAMLQLEHRQCDVSRFRERLRNGEYTFDSFKKSI